MLPNLPNEILIPIFFQLRQDDQMECMLVCHHWNQVINNHIIYRAVFIYSLASMNKLIEKVQQRPTIASKIERLLIHIGSEQEEERDTSNISLFLSLLVNLKALHCTTNTFTLHKKARYPWYNQIQYISEETYGYTPNHFLSFSSCPNLTTLKIEYVGYDFLPPMKNASALTSLTIDSAIFSFTQLELIHKHLPHLQFFKIASLDQLDGGFRSTDIITPATSMTEFVVTSHSCSSYLNVPVMPIELLLYISRKYPNLSKLTCEIFEEELSSGNFRNLNEIGWVPLLQRLGPQLEKICLYFPEYHHDFFAKLDQFSCNPNYLSLDGLTHKVLTKIAHSQQVVSIHTLVLKNITCEAFDWLKELCALKKLKLSDVGGSVSSHKMQMNDILNHSPPTLESLSLHVPYLDIDLNYAGTSNIKSLSLNNIKLNNKSNHRVDAFISRCFPRLSTLKLRNCKLQGDVFNLQTLNLVRFHYFELDFYHNRKTILVDTHGNNEQRFYYINNFKYEEINSALHVPFYPQNYLPVKSVLANEINDIVPDFTLVCHSVTHLFFTAMKIQT